MSRHILAAFIALLVGAGAAPAYEERAAPPADATVIDQRLAIIEAKLIALRATVREMKPAAERQTWVYQSEHLDVQVVAMGLKALLAAMDARITADAQKKTLTVDAPRSKMPAIKAFVLKVAFKPPEDAWITFDLYALSHRDAAEIAELINEMSRINLRRHDPPRSEVLHAVADTRNNVVLVRGTDAARARIRQVIAELDQDTSNDITAGVIRLKHRRAADVSRLVAVLLEGEGRSVIDEPTFNALVLSATAAEIERIRQFVEVIDIEKPAP